MCVFCAVYCLAFVAFTPLHLALKIGSWPKCCLQTSTNVHAISIINSTDSNTVKMYVGMWKHSTNVWEVIYSAFKK